MGREDLNPFGDRRDGLCLLLLLSVFLRQSRVGFGGLFLDTEAAEQTRAHPTTSVYVSPAPHKHTYRQILRCTSTSSCLCILFSLRRPIVETEIVSVGEW